MKDKLIAIWNVVVNQAKDVWNRSKVVIVAIGAIILALEYQKIKEWVIAYLGQKEMDNSKKQDIQLEAKEDTDNNKANALIEDAKNLPSQEKPVTADWNKK